MTRESGLDSASPLDFRKDIRPCHPGQKSVRIPARGSLRFFLTHLTCARLASGVLSSGSKRWGHARVLNPGSVGPIILLFLLNPKQISRLSQTIRNFYRQRIPDDDKRTAFLETLKMITIPEDMLAPTNPVFPEQIVTISQEHKIRLYKGEHLA